MGDIRGFLKHKRESAEYRPACERTSDYRDVAAARAEKLSVEQSSRCMDCGTPFCHWGCPLGNYIPEWNDYVYNLGWEKALKLLLATNNLPEITGRLCPAPCEYACVLAINDDPVTIRENELAIIEHGFRNNLMTPVKPEIKTGKKVAVIGSGPAGLACADQLNKAGHSVTVFERGAKAGGILRYGIPDFKLEKCILDRRIEVWKNEGIEFSTGTAAGAEILSAFDAVCLACGSRVPRDMKVDGRELSGIYFAMDYLTQSNMRVAGEKSGGEVIDAKGRKVVVIGGGDTGSDCVGTAHRQGARSVTQIEILPKPSECRPQDQPWPAYPTLFKTTSSHEEGGERHWEVSTKKFMGENGKVRKLLASKVKFSKDSKGCWVMNEVPGSEFEIEADMVVLAMGFLHPEKKGLVEELGLELDQRGNVKTGPDFRTSKDKIFCAGDMRRGQSSIVWAISEGRRAAHYIDKFLMGKTNLPNI
ncbi:MAG: glutamate synthase subunit beta [Elusimicrobiota bacterium]